MAGMNIIVGLECRVCGDHEREKDINSWLYDEDNYLIGIAVHCRKCEHVWDHLYRDDA